MYGVFLFFVPLLFQCLCEQSLHLPTFLCPLRNEPVFNFLSFFLVLPTTHLLAINVTVMDVVVMPNETNIGVATVVMPNLTPGPTTGVVMVVDTATVTDTAAADTAAVTADTATVTETRVAERRTTGGRWSNTPAKESRPSPVRSRWRKEASTPKNTPA